MWQLSRVVESVFKDLNKTRGFEFESFVPCLAGDTVAQVLGGI